MLGWVEGAAELEGLREGWLDGTAETDGRALSCKLGTPVLVGLALG